MKPGEQPGNRTNTALWRDYQMGPTLARLDIAIAGCNRFKGSNNRRTDRDDPMSTGFCSIYQLRRFRRDSVVFVVGWLMAFDARNAGVQNDRAHLHAFRHELRYDFRRKGPAGRRHFGTSWLVRIDRLIVSQRPKLSNITVTDRKSVVVQIIEYIAG